MEVAGLVNVGTVWINSFQVEKGVQTRKMSGNYNLSGFESIKDFVVLKTEKTSSEAVANLETVQKNLKTFGSADSSQTIPAAQSVDSNKTYKLYVGGKQTRPDSQASRNVYLPGSDKIYCLIPDAGRKDVRNAVEAANSAYNGWSKRLNHNKSQIIYYFGENFSTRATDLAEKLSVLTGKSLEKSQLEVKQCIEVIFYFASVCDKYVGKVMDTTEQGYLLQMSDSVGTIGLICGNNTQNPLLSLITYTIGAIAYGNSVIVVPSSKAAAPVALDLYEIFDTSDMPPGVVNILTGDKHHLTKYLAEHQQLNAIWYINDQNEESLAKQFVQYTCGFSLKRSWLLGNGQSWSRDVAFEIMSHSTQSKLVHIPVGTIFAN